MYLNSRYKDGPVAPATKKSVAVYVVDRVFPPFPDYVVYRWKMGDRIDLVAGVLGIPRVRWWEIMDVNPEIPIPTMIKPGTVIRIPKS